MQVMTRYPRTESRICSNVDIVENFALEYAIVKVQQRREGKLTASEEKVLRL